MKLLRRIGRLWRWRRLQEELREELESHRAMKEEALRAAGLGEAEARAEAARAVGNLTLAAERSRAVWLAPWLESLWQDARHGGRALRRQPGFTAVAVLALALGIGLNTSVFTVFNALALRPWPVRNADRLVSVYRRPGPDHRGVQGWSIVAARQLRARARTLSGVVADLGQRVALGAGAEARRASVHYVSGDYFQVLGVDMALGRPFAPDEDDVGAPRAVAVLSHAAWQARFGGDPGVLDRTVAVDDVPFTVVGVAAASFAGVALEGHDLWIPLAAMALVPSQKEHAPAMLTRADQCCVPVRAVLAPGVTRAQAAAELGVLEGEVTGKPGHGVLLTSTAPLAHPAARQKMLPVFLLMFVGVALVLLLACANVANLLIARAAARQREIAVRLALGAGRARLVRQLMIEGSVLAGLAALVGLAMAAFLPGQVFRLLDDPPPAALRVAPDLLVAGYAAVVAAVATLVFALVPALHGTRGGIRAGLEQRGWLTGARFSLRASLLSLQLAVSVVLLVACALTTRGVQRGRTMDPRFDPGPVLVTEVDLPAAAYDGRAAAAFLKELLREVEQAPGVTAAALTAFVPLGDSRSATEVHPTGAGPRQRRIALSHNVSAGYFATLGIPVVSGRTFGPADEARPTALVNETMARTFWPERTPLGATLAVDDGGAREVIGVVRDAYTNELDRIEPTVYLPFARGRAALLVRGGDPSLVRTLLEPREPRARATSYPLAGNIARSLRSSRTGASLAAGLGLLALVLAAIGVMGVVAYSVEQRTREIGVRMALGATRRQVVRFVLAANTRAVLAGMAGGLVASALASRFLEGHLFGVSRLDPVSYGVVLALLAVAGVAATVVPARKATRIDPMIALRRE